VLREIGLADAQIAALAREGAVSGPGLAEEGAGQPLACGA